MFVSRSIQADHKDLIHDVAYDFYGERLATCSSDQTVKVWDKGEDKQWHCTASWKTHCGSVWKVTWAHPEFGQVIATCSFDRTVTVWEELGPEGSIGEKSQSQWVKKISLVDSRTPVTDVKFAPKHLGLQLATCSADGVVRIYEAPDVMNLSQWALHHEIPCKYPCSCISWNLSSTPAPEKKRDLGHFENRRGTKLTPVKLNSLKMPVPSATQKSSSTMSFMPKGSSLSRNIRRTNDDSDLSRSQFSARPQIALPQDDLNESFNSDDGSKYSYEETEDDMERSYDDMNPSDVGSQFSPPHSAIGSPEALDINSLVQLGTKLPPRLESSKKTPHLQSLKEEQPPSLSLRKSGQQTFLKPLQQQPKKKTTLKSGKTKNVSSLSNKCEQYGTDEDLDSKIAAFNEEQRLRFESIQREWAAMQEELVRDQKTKYDKMSAESSKKLEEDELSLRKENAEKLSKMKSELEKKIEQEESSVQVTLVDIKKTNEQKYAEEEKELKMKLENLNETMKIEIEKMEQENTDKISKRKEQLDNVLEIEMDKLTSSQKKSLRKLEESHTTEIALLENVHKEKIEKILDTFTKEENEAHDKVKEDQPPESDSSRIEMQKMKELLKKEQAKYEELLTELNNLQANISSEKENLAKLEEKTATAQTSYEEVQDEVDRTENDLDLLRTEKSALISELNILKENIKNDKSNLLKEKNMDVQSHKKPETLNKGINTSISYSVVSQATQTYTETRNISCQIKEIAVSTVEMYTQTFDQKAITSDISCQVDLVQKATLNKIHDATINNADHLGRNYMDFERSNIKSSMENDNINVDVFVSKVLEKAMMGISDKMETRFKSIEEKLGSLDKNLDSPNRKSLAYDASHNIPVTNIKSCTHPIEQNQYRCTTNNRKDPNDTLPVSTSLPSRNRCSCEKGDAGSCEVMQDVKSSIFRLNDILGTSFVPSLGNTVISGFNYPSNNYSSPLESFYSQFRQLQEKHRVTELKHKLQSESWKETASHLKPNSTNQIRNFNGAQALQFNRPLNSSPFSGVLDDPVSRARNLVLTEQARSWKQQQYLSAPDQQGFLPLDRSHIFSISDISPSSTSSGFSARSSTFQYPFRKFVPDPESEYNEWMSRLKTLQDKIRSHKIL